MVHERKVDFAVDPFGWRKDRLQVVDYLAMNKNSYGQIYIVNPKESYDWQVYLKPLTTESWIAVSLFCLIVPILMLVVMFGCKYLLVNREYFDVRPKIKRN